MTEHNGPGVWRRAGVATFSEATQNAHCETLESQRVFTNRETVIWQKT